MLKDDEIVTSLQEESDPVDDETDEDEDNNNNESIKSPSNADAFSAVRFHILHGSQSVFGYPNNRVSERIRINVVLQYRPIIPEGVVSNDAWSNEAHESDVCCAALYRTVSTELYVPKHLHLDLLCTGLSTVPLYGA
ncbi:hypothetical protein TNCV_1627151 [Trichonephila clavipes]|nr:hypothetical protein TNCV_1627151 [Trichonephila clavipes]